MMKRIFFHKLVGLLFTVIYLTVFMVLPASASNFKVQGKLYFPDDNALEIPVNSISVKTYKIGSKDIYNAEIEKDGRGQVSFVIEIEELKKNDQLFVLAEVDQVEGLFGGLSTVITEKELTSGAIGSLTIYMNEIPIPDYENTEGDNLKICWKGMDDFSVVGYEVYRSDLVDGEFESVGRAGQTAGRQVCFVDSNAEAKTKYFYRLGVLNSWNAGEGSEVMMSDVLSGISSGLMRDKGVVENREAELATTEKDMSMVVSNVNDKTEFYDQYINWFKNEVEKRGWSYQMTLLIAIAVVLFLIIAFFVLSVEFANIRSGGSGVWERRVVKSIFSDIGKKQRKK